MKLQERTGGIASAHPGKCSQEQPRDKPAAGWQVTHIDKDAEPVEHQVVPTQTVVTARGPGSNSIPQSLLFTGVVWLLREAHFLLPNFSNQLHAASYKILKGNLPIFICAQLVHDLSHRLFHVQLATDHQQVIPTKGVEPKKCCLGERFEVVSGKKKKFFFWVYSPQAKRISNILVASRKVVSVQNDLFHLSYSRQELYYYLGEWGNFKSFVLVFSSCFHTHPSFPPFWIWRSTCRV